MSAAAIVSAPQPVLARKPRTGGFNPPFLNDDGTPGEYDYGAFLYIDDWELTGGCKGVIVQKITRTLKVVWGNGQPLSDALITSWQEEGREYHLDCMEYWECFRVSAAAARRSPGHQNIDGDQFQASPFRPPDVLLSEAFLQGVRGAYSMTGTAAFYPTNVTDRVKLGFGPISNNVALAAGLISSRHSPMARLELLVPGWAGMSNPVTRTVTSTWYSKTRFGKSETEVI